MQSRFQRRFLHSSTYACFCCNRQTRETGLGESNLDLCAFCYEASGLLNSWVDGAIDRATFDAELSGLEVQYGTRSHIGCVTPRAES